MTMLAVLIAALPFTFAPTDDINPGPIMLEIDYAAQHVALWPGFDPAAYPIAFFTGTTTWLYRYPTVPEGFTETTIIGSPLLHAGRHPIMVANTSADLDGVKVGTVMLDGMKELAPRQIAAIAVHELFHVYQRANHPNWSANEAVIFTWPHDEAEIFALRRLETIFMRRALNTITSVDRLALAMRALELRRQRVTLMPAEHAEYERRSELNEGLARYIQGLVDQSDATKDFPADEWPLTHVRQRTYATGRFWASILDLLAPEWKERFNADDSLTLDQYLYETLRQAGVQPAEIAGSDIESARAAARKVVAGLAAEQRRTREEFLAADGWRIVIGQGAGAALALQGFDPINVFNLGGGEILHYRMLEMGNAACSVKIIGRASLSMAAGPHPLFSGVARITITGIATEPKIVKMSDKTVVSCEGVEIEANRVDVDTATKTVNISLE